MKRTLDRILILVTLLTLVLAGCGPSYNPIGKTQAKDSASGYETGQTKAIRVDGSKKNKKTIDVPYTISGQKKIFDQIRKELGSNTDLLMAKTVENVFVTLQNDKGEATQAKPSKMKIEVKMKPLYASVPAALEFAATLTASATQLTAKDVAQKGFETATYPFTADVTCHDMNCRVVELRLKKHASSSDKKVLGEVLPGQVGILFRTSYPGVRIKREKKAVNNGDASSSMKKLESELPNKTAVRSSVVVVNGPSYSIIQVPGILDVETDLLDTNETSVGVNNLTMNDKSADAYSAELVGNDPNTGSLMLDLSNQKTQESLRLYIEDKDEVVEAPEKGDGKESSAVYLPPATALGPKLFKVKFDPKRLPETARVTALFDEYLKDPETQRLMRIWLGQEKHSGPASCRISDFGPRDLEQFLSQMPLVAPYVDQIAEKLDITPEIAYLLMFESAYSKNPNFPTDQMPKPTKKNPNPSALGPWQIIYGTAKSIAEKSGVAFQIFKTKNRAPNLRDDRTYFMNSTYMAALYLKELFSQFQDPAMAIFSYHAGDGDGRSVVRATQKFEKFDITMAEVLKYRVKTKANCSIINYTYAFLAIRTIGQNLDYFKLTGISVAKTEAYKKRLRNPLGFLPPGI